MVEVAYNFVVTDGPNGQRPAPRRIDDQYELNFLVAKEEKERVMGFEPTTFCLGSKHSAN